MKRATDLTHPQPDSRPLSAQGLCSREGAIYLQVLASCLFLPSPPAPPPHPPSLPTRLLPRVVSRWLEAGLTAFCFPRDSLSWLGPLPLQISFILSHQNLSGEHPPLPQGHLPGVWLLLTEQAWKWGMVLKSQILPWSLLLSTPGNRVRVKVGLGREGPWLGTRRLGFCLWVCASFVV